METFYNFIVALLKLELPIGIYKISFFEIMIFSALVFILLRLVFSAFLSD